MKQNLLRIPQIVDAFSPSPQPSPVKGEGVLPPLPRRERGGERGRLIKTGSCQPFTQTSIIRALALCLILAGTNVAQAQSFGRLFFTPKERAVLDRTGTGPPAELVEVKPAAPSRPAEINGFVKRSNGKDTIWIDGQPRYAAEPLHISPSAVRTPGGPIVVRRPSHADADTPDSRQR